jgi:hypothetical protein
MEELKKGFFIAINKMGKGNYSLGACISSQDMGALRETYLFINLLVVSISIGIRTKAKSF